MEIIVFTSDWCYLYKDILTHMSFENERQMELKIWHLFIK